MQATKEQWDYPNAWPPLQAFLIQGLDRTNQRLAQVVAFRLAQTWLSTNYKGYANYQMMFEKVSVSLIPFIFCNRRRGFNHFETSCSQYNSLQSGETGTGGEYLPQTGFGWTNGLILEFLDRWGKQVTHYDSGKFILMVNALFPAVIIGLLRLLPEEFFFFFENCRLIFRL